MAFGRYEIPTQYFIYINKHFTTRSRPPVLILRFGGLSCMSFKGVSITSWPINNSFKVLPSSRRIW